MEASIGGQIPFSPQLGFIQIGGSYERCMLPQANSKVVPFILYSHVEPDGAEMPYRSVP